MEIGQASSCVRGCSALAVVIMQCKNANAWYGSAVAFGDQGAALKIRELEVIDDLSQIDWEYELAKLLEMNRAVLMARWLT